MNEVTCPGLPAEWLNGWLAAVGLLVLEPRLRLSWTAEPSPTAVLTTTTHDEDPIEAAVNAWPDFTRLEQMPIAEHLDGLPPMGRSVPLEVFRTRVQASRRHADSWTLSSTVTDLCVDAETAGTVTVRHARLDPKGPGTIGSLHRRLAKSHKTVEQPSDAVRASLMGSGKRVVDNGLGFDASRITGLADSAVKLVDPVIEVLAFFGLRVLPMRGTGVEIGKSGTRLHFPARQRCWHLDPAQSSKAPNMIWPAWSQKLGLEGIDALLDLWSHAIEQAANGRSVPRDDLSRLGIHAGWHSRAYQPRGRGDTTVGLISAPLRLDAPRR